MEPVRVEAWLSIKRKFEDPLINLKVLTELDLHASRTWLRLEQCEISMDLGTVSEMCLLSQREIEPQQ